MSVHPHQKSDKLRVIVLGFILRYPLGGMVWHHLQYVLGLSRLGHDVYYLEDSGESPWACYDPERHVSDREFGYGMRFVSETFNEVGLGDRWAYYDAHKLQWHGPCCERATELCEDADLVLNLSFANPLRPWLTEVPIRAYIDTDPVFTQVRHLTEAAAREEASRHTAFFSFGENIGKPNSTIPDDGFPWRPTRQPVVLDAWSLTTPSPKARFSTVMKWESFSAKTYGGKKYGMKSDSFYPYLELPKRANADFELCVGGPAVPVRLLADNGWIITDPYQLSLDPWAYQRYIQESKAEFSVAKHGYVATRSGWFSERSAAYLASGRPVLVQDTGFSDRLPTGRGLIPFTNIEEAIGGIESLAANYTGHCTAARELAEEHFDAPRVLTELIDAAMNLGTSWVKV